MAELTNANNARSGTLRIAKAIDVIFALIAMLVTWSLVNAPEPFFMVPKEYHLPELGPSQERYNRYLVQQYRVDYQNAALVVGIIGSILGFGLATGRSGRFSVAVRVFAGCVLGFLAGAVAGVVGCHLQLRLTQENQLSVLQSSMINGTFFAVMGAGLGIAIGWLSGGGSSNLLKHVMAGLVAGAFGGVLYPVIVSQTMASVNIEAFIPTHGAARLLWAGIGSLMIGLLMPLTDAKASATTKSSNIPD